jgi:hypothetical protein
VGKDQLLDAGCLGHLGRAGGSALTDVLTVLVHDLLVIPAHAEHHVGALCQVNDALAGLGVAGEHDAALRAVQAVRQRVEPGLNVNGRGGRHLPVWGLMHQAGADVVGANGRGHSGQHTAAIDVHLLAGGGVDPRDPVVCERADLLVEDAAGEFGRWGRPEDLELVRFTGRLVPAAEQEAGIVNVVIEMVVGEEEVVDLGWPETGLDQLVGGGRAAVEHHVLAADVDDVRRAEPLGGGCRGAGSQDVNLHGVLSSRG